jgi:hypothetical protein
MPRPWHCVQLADQYAHPQPTQAYHNAVFNPLDGVIVLLDSESPQKKLTQPDGDLIQPLPAQHGYVPFSASLWNVWNILHDKHIAKGEDKDSRLSSWLWSHWKNGPTFVPMVSNKNCELMRGWLNWICVTGIDNPAEVSIILRCLQARGGHPGDVPDWDRRQTFQLGHWYVSR